MIMYSPFHVTLYMQGSCVVTLNPNSEGREKSAGPTRLQPVGVPENLY